MDLDQLSDQELADLRRQKEAEAVREFKPVAKADLDSMSDEDFANVKASYMAHQESALATYRQQAAEKATGEGTTNRLFLKKFTAPIRDFGMNIPYGIARGRLNRGEASESDARAVAQYEHEQYQASQETEGQKFFSGVLRVPGELALLGGGGKLAKAIMPAALAGGGVLSAAARTGIQAAVTPNLIPAQIIHQNMEAGRDPLDIQGVAPGAIKGLAELAVLQGAGAVWKKVLPSRMTSTALREIGTAGLTGPISQQVTDLTTYGLGLSTRKGRMQDFAESKYGEFAAGVVLDIFNFAAMHAMHGEPEKGKALLDDAAKTIAKEQGNGLTAKAAAEKALKDIASEETPPPSPPEAQPQPPGPPQPSPEPQPTQTPPEVVPTPPVQPAEPLTPRQQADSLEAQHRQAQARKLQLDEAARRLKGEAGMGLNRQKELKAVLDELRPLRKALGTNAEPGTLSVALDQARQKAAALEASQKAPGLSPVAQEFIQGSNDRPQEPPVAKGHARYYRAEVENYGDTLKTTNPKAAYTNLYEEVKRFLDENGGTGSIFAVDKPIRDAEGVSGPPEIHNKEWRPIARYREKPQVSPEPSQTPPAAPTAQPVAPVDAPKTTPTQQQRRDTAERVGLGLGITDPAKLKQYVQDSLKRGEEAGSAVGEAPKLSGEDLHTVLAAGRTVPGLTATQSRDLYLHVVQDIPLEEVGRRRGVTRQAVFDSLENVLEKLHGHVEEPPAPTIASKTEKPQVEAGALPSRLQLTQRYETAITQLYEQWEQERQHAGGELHEDRNGWYVSEARKLYDEQDKGKTSGPALRRSIERDQSAKAVAGSLPERPAGSETPVRPGDVGPVSQGTADAPAPTPAEGVGSPTQGNATNPTAPGRGVPAAGHELGRGATPIERAQYANPRTTEYLKQAILMRSHGARSLYDEVIGRGGINRESLANVGLDARTLVNESGLPARLFPKKGGQAIDTLAAEWLNPENRWQLPPAPEGTHDFEHVINLLQSHFLVEGGRWADREAMRQQEAHYREQIAAEIGRANPEASQEAIDAEVDRLIGQSEETGWRESSTRPAAQVVHDATEGRETLGGGDDYSGDAGTFDPAEFTGPQQSGPAGEPGQLPPGMGAATGGLGPPEPPPPPGTPGAAAPEVPEPGPRVVPPSNWFQKAKDFLHSYGQQTYPALSRVSPASADGLARAANAPKAAKAGWDYFSRILKLGNTPLGDLTPEEDRAMGATFLERRMREFRTRLNREGLDSSKVGTLVGQPGSPLTTEADYQDYRTSDAMRTFWEAYRQEWSKEADKNFRGLMGLQPDDELDSRSQIPGLPLNAIALDESDARQGYVGTGKRQGLENVKLRKPQFTKTAGLNAAAYDVSLTHMMQKTLNLGVPAARRAEAVRTGIAEGVLQAVSGKEKPNDGWVYLALDPARGLPGLDKNASYYANPEVAQEYIQGLGIGQRPGQRMIGPAVKWLGDRITGIALMTPVELATHTANHFTALFEDGMGVPIWNLKDSFRNAWDLWKRDPAILEKVKNLTEMSAAFGHEPRPGFLGEGLKKYDPTYYIGRITGGFVDLMQKAVRVQLSDAYDRMAQAGEKPDTPGAKRDFINRAVGNYNTHADNFLTQFLKDTGIQPFATAASTFTTQGMRKALSPIGLGVPTAENLTVQASIQNRVATMLKLAPFLAMGPVINSLLRGQAFPKGVPAFAVQTQDEQDGQVKYFDPLGFTGLRRGWRATGLNEMIERAAHGDEDRGNFADRELADFLHTAEHQVAGPAVQFLHTALTGENMMGHRVSQKVSTAKTALGMAKASGRGAPPPGSSQRWQDIQAAALNTNAAVGAFMGADRPKKPRTILENLMQNVGPFGEKTRSAR